MPRTSFLTRSLAILTTAILLVAAVSFGSILSPDRQAIDAVPTPPLRDWPMFGGTPQRNLANPLVKNLPSDWSVEEGKQKNIKWVANLGSYAFGGTVIADGRIYVGTNNRRPRDKNLIDKDGHPRDLGVIMCFRESDGAFLWQAVHVKVVANGSRSFATRRIL